MRKKTQTLTAREKPKAREMYSNWAGLAEVGCWIWVDSEEGDVEELATWVADRAKKRNRKVPVNSPDMAMKWFRTELGIQFM